MVLAVAAEPASTTVGVSLSAHADPVTVAEAAVVAVIGNADFSSRASM